VFASLDDAVAFVQDSTYLSDAQKSAVLDHNAEQMLGATLTALTSTAAVGASPA